MAAFYRATLHGFLSDQPHTVLGCLTAHVTHNELQRRQIKAWEREIDLLRLVCGTLLGRFSDAPTWSLLLEYPIPRRQKRLDAVVLAHDVILCIEFKTEDKAHSLQARRQVEDYALDLRDFHEASRVGRLAPIVVVPKAPRSRIASIDDSTDPVASVRLANEADLSEVVAEVFECLHCENRDPINAEKWDKSPYRPVPTIIEAAEALYAGHNVREIAHSHAGATNLTLTSEKLVEIIQAAQVRAEKVICFVTGVPGAGKTLAGLNIVHNPALRSGGRPAGVFLSGNGPLVKVVSAAIARDQRRRTRIGDETRTVATFVQNVHVFIREGLEKADKPPVERVVVFDEAQRAWNAEQNRKKNGIEVSEPETMLGIMDRHEGWAVLVALVGGGQEIHNGEAGLSEWGKALRDKFRRWKIVVSPKALEPDASLAGHRLFHDGISDGLQIQREPSLHLEVNLRSFRARKLAEWVDALLIGAESGAAAMVPELADFPIAMTRSLPKAREWLRGHTRGRRRCGLVASSGALRLRADGLELSSGFRQGNRDMFVHWFLAEPPDVRSSNQLEIAASEFECQGLELDWVGVCWGADFTYDKPNGWSYRCFSGSRWGNIADDKVTDRRYLLNTYRVLLTRAREGLMIWVPEGSPEDPTRPPAWLNATADHLARCGLPTI